jgi:predicted Abi (CAAX) family protease
VDEDQVANLATWASTFPSSVAEGGLGNALARWSSLDPRQALDWLRAKPAAERESLVVQMIRSQVVPASPEIVALAYNIRDVQKRDEALSILVRSLTIDGDAAEQIRALGLSTSQTKHLLELLPVPTE